MDVRTNRSFGSVYTPLDFAHFLTSWAITSTSDTSLDIGVGEGVFVFSAFERLKQLGANTKKAQKQIYGAEVDLAAYNRFLAHSEELGLQFPNVHCQDFFTLGFPEVDAVIGNPPYVRRMHLNNVNTIREQVIATNPHVLESELRRLTDLYVYFLLQALAHLKPGGRCAVITADPWLTVGYGQVLKRYLQSYFHINCLITFDRRVFEDAEVKPVILLATRLDEALASARREPLRTYFVRVKNGLAVRVIEKSVQDNNFDLPDVSHAVVEQTALSAEFPWSIYFRAPEICEELAKLPMMIPLSNLAETRIGIQTLAKEFFVIPSQLAVQMAIEPEYLAPFAQSPRFFRKPKIDIEIASELQLFYCSKSKEELAGTNALNYILQGESQTVAVRGKEGVTVAGYQNKERMQRSGRKHWYDLKTSVERRGRASILIPRLVYRSYSVIWNKAKWVPGELFIEFLPRPIFAVEDEVYLAILTSSVAEVMLRVNAQVYGGGTYNINPGPVKKVPILNASLLSVEQRLTLKRLYHRFLKDPKHDRSAIDAAVFDILGLSHLQRRLVLQAQRDLVLIATSIKKSATDHPEPHEL